MSTAHPGKSGTARLWFCILLLSLVTFLPSGTIGAKVDVAGEQRALTAVIVLPDDGKSAIIDEIDAARYSIRLYLYLLSDEDVIRALLRAHLRGVDVRVMLEQEPYGGAQTEQETWMRLDAAGINVRWSPDEFRFAHVKLMIIDDAVALVMNLNLTAAALTQNREFAILSTTETVVAEATALFDADWDNSTPDDPQGLVVSPINSRSVLISMIEDARKSIDIYAEVVSDLDVVGALVEALTRGVEIRILVSELDGESLWHEESGFLARSGAHVGVLNSFYVHAKVVVVDREVVWIGSQNLTATSLDENREVGIVTDDDMVLARVIGVFETDWAQSRALSGAA